MGRTKDIGVEPLGVIKNTRLLLDRSDSDAEIIIGSIRHERDIIDSFIATPLLRVSAWYAPVQS